MRQKTLLLFVTACCLSMAGYTTAQSVVQKKQYQFHGMGNPDDGYVSRAFDVSANGNVVVGRNELDPFTNALIIETGFRWTSDEGQKPLGYLGGIPHSSAAFGVSADGGYAVGRSWSDGIHANEAALWEESADPVGLGFLDGLSQTEATAVSRLGEYVVGTNQFLPDLFNLPPYRRAFRWSEDTGMVDIGSLTPTGDSSATDVSRTGTHVVGTASSLADPSNPLIRVPYSQEAFVWSPDGGMVGLGHYDYDPTDIPNAYLNSIATAVSANGEFVVGSSALVSLEGQADLFHRGFLWTQATGYQDLGDLPMDVCCFEYDPVDVSNNGQIVIGNATLVTTEPELSTPFIWTREDGLQVLADWMLTEYGISDLGGWELGEIAAISDDGTTLVGTGTNPDGEQEAWRFKYSPSAKSQIVRLPLSGNIRAVPEPAGVPLSCLGIVGMLWARRCRRHGRV